MLLPEWHISGSEDEISVSAEVQWTFPPRFAEIVWGDGETTQREIIDLQSEPAFGKDGAVHPHYTDKLGAVSHCARHEAFHAGQLATIRRLLGKPFLR